MPAETQPDRSQILPRARQILLPLVATEDEREALLTDAFYLLPDSRLYHLIKREGTAMAFTTQCIRKLIDYGCVTEETHALSQLLGAARMYCGIDKHAEIDDLVTLADKMCAESTSASTDSDAATQPPAQGVQTLATPISERGPTVFISYSHADDTFAQKLIADLNATGHACWIDTSAIKGGADWQRAICDGINQSYALVVVCTHRALQSEYVWDEIQWARTRKKLIIPVLLEDVTNDDRFFGLHRFQGIRFDALPYAEALAGLLDALPTAPDTADATTGPRIVSRREHELAYLDRLRFDDFRLEKFELAEYAALGGVAQTYREQPDAWEALAMKQEFAVIRDVHHGSEDAVAPPEAFTDAVSKISELRRVVVLGDPGAGKTHTLRAIAKPLYTAALNDPKAPLPLLVKLGNWDDPTQSFEDFVRESLGELGQHLDELLAAQRAVLLFDGLNEFPANQRRDKYPQVEQFIKQQPDVRAVVTCREADYPISLHLNKVLIRPLDPLRIRDFARRALHSDERGDVFFWKLAGGEQIRAVWEKWEQAGADLKLFWDAPDIPRENPNVYGITSGSDDRLWREHVLNPASIMRLASNPYMLRMLLDVYIQFKGVLPTNRGQLFAQFVDVLLEREKLAHINEKTKAVTLSDEGRALLDGLQQVAFEMQMQRAGTPEDGESSAGTSLPLMRVREILNDRLLYLAVSTSILNSGDDVRFTHQLLQEYFAAQYIDREIQAGQLHASDIWKPESWWERTNWEEAVILLAGLYSDDCTNVVDWANAANPEVAALCVTRSGAKLADSTREKLRDEWISRLTDVQHEPNPQARAAVGRALGLTNLDNRKGVSVIVRDGVMLPEIDWVTIPAGEFTYQDGKMTLDYGFQISRYPVTYAQFQAFIDDSEGFNDLRWWAGLAIPDGHNAAPGDQIFKYWNHPRERVSWYDAMAFCRWLSWRLGGGHDLSAIEKWAVRLPTEYEWERTARGTEGREYPYEGKFDATRGNTRETGIGQTSAVGIFPNGASPEGVLDMSGNVWEWCLTDDENPKLRAADENLRSDAWRVLRGGSWYDSLNDARAASRLYDLPVYRSYSYGGFRLCCVRAPSL